MVIDFITTPIWKALGEETDRATNAETDLKRNTFANAEYVSSEKVIYLSNGFGEVIDSIDCTDFIIDGMVENVMDWKISREVSNRNTLNDYQLKYC